MSSMKNELVIFLTATCWGLIVDSNNPIGEKIQLRLQSNNDSVHPEMNNAIHEQRMTT